MRISSLLRAFIVVVIATGTPILMAESPPSDQLAELSASMRTLIEPGFEEAVGFGFATFECRVETALVSGSRFDCDAVDLEGDRIIYTLEVDDEGMASIVLASQPAGDLTQTDLEVLEPPCRRFLDLYSKGDWDALIDELDPTVLESTPPDEIRAQLAPIREALGKIRSAAPVSYGRHASGRHEMEYELVCADGPGFARFGMAIDEQGARLTAFLVSPTPGSALHARLLAIEGRDTIAEVIGDPVDRLDAPTERLHSIGDAVEGTAYLADGRELIIGVVQQGRADDFDSIDYRFQILEVSWLLMRAFASRPEPATSVDCPTRTAPDGGTMTCEVHLNSDEDLAVTVARRSGDHRIVDSQPVDR